MELVSTSSDTKMSHGETKFLYDAVIHVMMKKICIYILYFSNVKIYLWRIRFIFICLFVIQLSSGERMWTVESSSPGSRKYVIDLIGFLSLLYNRVHSHSPILYIWYVFLVVKLSGAINHGNKYWNILFTSVVWFNVCGLPLTWFHGYNILVLWSFK